MQILTTVGIFDRLHDWWNLQYTINRMARPSTPEVLPRHMLSHETLTREQA